MKRVSIFLLLLCIFAGIGGQTAECEEPPVFRIGLSSSTLGTINRNDYMAAFKSWVTMVGREQALPVAAEAKMVVAGENMRSALHQKKLDALTLTVEDLMFLKVQPDSVFVTCRGEKSHVRYAVIVRGDSGIIDLDELKGRRVVTYEGSKMVLARPWLEVLLAGIAKGPVNEWLGNLIETENASKSILQVFFRQSHAALVTRDAFDVACELNPQLRKDIKLLSVSPPLIPNFFMFRPSYRGKFREKLAKAIEDVHTTPGGRQVLAIFQSSRMQKQPASILEPTLRFLTEYRRLMQEGGQP